MASFCLASGLKTVNRPPHPNSSFLEGINNQCKGWVAAFGDKVCITSALSVSWCVGTVVIGKPGEELERDRGQSGIYSNCCYGE